jgi:hypothetical protein
VQQFFLLFSWHYATFLEIFFSFFKIWYTSKITIAEILWKFVFAVAQ